MRIELIREINRETCANLTACSFILGAKKILILEQLEHTVKQLREARFLIREAVQETLKMKEYGDDIADQIIATVAELVTAK